ncbi:hypothetical protein [Nostoc sp. DedQUE09]|uniref:hypothetical protein n=1 Tax=Nostoc sp. DedQUE09 TaxID=3075394 RepID=UPI002AD257A4|nr:hypothetical protein [Nostoc sp. DedQUE09]MDZ7953512.1 hypothetical protein [Nostoc sp. DedQUE09]
MPNTNYNLEFLSTLKEALQMIKDSLSSTDTGELVKAFEALIEEITFEIEQNANKSQQSPNLDRYQGLPYTSESKTPISTKQNKSLFDNIKSLFQPHTSI